MAEGRHARVYRILVSAFVFIVLSAQIATLIPNAQGRGIGARFWPILTYGMYATSNQEGEVIDVHHVLEGVTTDGRAVAITRQELGLGMFPYINLVRELAAGRDRALGDFLRFYRRNDLVELRVKSYPLKLTRDGHAATESTLMNTIRIDGSDPK